MKSFTGFFSPDEEVIIMSALTERLVTLIEGLEKTNHDTIIFGFALDTNNTYKKLIGFDNEYWTQYCLKHNISSETIQQ